MSLRFPGADTPEEFWRTIHAGSSHIRRFTAAELAAAGVPPETYQDPEYVGASSVIPGIDTFDAEFFSMSAREARLTDPQHRVFLECCHHALEDAGYAGAPQDSVRVGVFASSGYHMYSLQSYLHNNVLSEPVGDAWIPRMQRDVGNYADFLATRASFRLGLTGPALGVQTACSSSLVATHLARLALLAGDADVMVVGAAAIHVPQVLGYRHVVGSILSPTGTCRAFDAASNGTVAGSGVAAVVLKRLDRALADGDTVHAVILGSGVSNDGSGKQHYTEPSATGQRAAVRAALASAGVSAESVGYVESHGTGTYKGDPIEFAALTEVFRGDTARTGFCGIGALKANLGHLDVCAGLAGLIKAVLVLREGVIPPLAGFTAPNPLLAVEESPFYLPVTARAWPLAGPRRAGVTSLGVGGTNAHVVLEQRPEPVARPRRAATGAPPAMVPVSGRTAKALRANAGALRDHLRAHPETDPADLVTTLALGRRPLRHRLVAFGDTPTELADALDGFVGALDAGEGQAPDAARGPAPRYLSAEVPRSRLPAVAWVFSGQGAARSGMAAALYQRHPVVREVLDRCEERYRAGYGGSLLDGLLGTVPAGDADGSWPTEIAQPALFAFQAAQTALWRRLTDPPDLVAGHSLGEYAALHAAGALSLEDGLRLTALRGRLMQRGTAPGGMIAVFADQEAARQVTRGLPGLELAVVNGERHQVLSGPPEALAEAGARLDADAVPWRRLPVDRAFHSALLDPVREELAAACATVELASLTTSFVQGTDGVTRPSGWSPDPAYLVEQARSPVRFDRVLRGLDQAGARVLLELGPDRTLSALAGAALPRTLALPTQRRGLAAEPLWHAAAQLHCRGHTLHWRELLADGGGGRVPLPGYRFQRRTYWMGPELVDLFSSDGDERAARAPADEPRKGTVVDQVLLRVVELTAQQLGFAVTEVGPDTSFFDLGADSLQMITMLRELEGEFHVKVAMRKLFDEAGTPRLLAELVASQSTAGSAGTAGSAEAERGAPARATASVEPADPAAPADRAGTGEPVARAVTAEPAGSGPEPEPVPTVSSGPPVPAPTAELPLPEPAPEPAPLAALPLPEPVPEVLPPPEPPRDTPSAAPPAPPNTPYATQEALEELTRQVRQLAQVQVQLMRQLSQLLAQQLATAPAGPGTVPALNGKDSR